MIEITLVSTLIFCYCFMGGVNVALCIRYSTAETRQGEVLQPIFVFFFWPLIFVASLNVRAADELAERILDGLDQPFYRHGVIKIGHLIAFRGATMFELQYRRLIVTLAQRQYWTRRQWPWLKVRWANKDYSLSDSDLVAESPYILTGDELERTCQARREGR